MTERIYLSSGKPIKRAASCHSSKSQKNKMCSFLCIKRLPNGTFRYRKRVIIISVLVFGLFIYFLFANSASTPNKYSESINIIPSTDKDNNNQTTVNRTFVVDFTNNQFLKDGQPFRYISGSFDYFRAVPDTWQHKLRMMRAAGLNAVSTYVEWSLHNSQDGVYNWDGMANLVEFIKLAEKEDLLVLLRAGPYICAERDMGGLPYWLLTKYPEIKLRTSDQNYTFEVRKWFSELMPRIQPHLYGNGGPIIMIQIENEYGWFDACDRKYTTWLKNETEKYVQNKALLYTCDPSSLLSCGKIDGVFTTVDFGPGSDDEIDSNWHDLRKYQPQGPLVNSEFYTGWLTHWHEKKMQKSKPELIQSLKHILDANASLNFYMFYGGTNFGFSSGANIGTSKDYLPDVTSYDYDSPMNEAGDPTEKYFAIRDTIAKYLPPPKIEVPEKYPKMNLPSVRMGLITPLLSNLTKTLSTKPVNSKQPLSFESLNQNSGFVLYETMIPSNIKKNDCQLTVNQLRDHAHILLNGFYVGQISRSDVTQSLPITLSSDVPVKLQILVENQGRINFILANDFKGILGNVTLDDIELTDWTHIGYPLNDYNQIEKVINAAYVSKQAARKDISSMLDSQLSKGPTIFHASFNISTPLADTYLNPTGWEKGIVFLNGFNLGRYWPTAGPQISLYVPKELFKSGINKLTLIEYYTVSKTMSIAFDNHSTMVN